MIFLRNSNRNQICIPRIIFFFLCSCIYTGSICLGCTCLFIITTIFHLYSVCITRFLNEKIVTVIITPRISYRITLLHQPIKSQSFCYITFLFGFHRTNALNRTELTG